MTILTIKTDQPMAEIGLYENQKQLAYETWEAHRQLSVTIHAKIAKLLNSRGKDWHDIEGLVCFLGPGSFTGLRISTTVANTLAVSLSIPISGTTGKVWIESGIRMLKQGSNLKRVIPFYGRDPNITTPRK